MAAPLVVLERLQRSLGRRLRLLGLQGRDGPLQVRADRQQLQLAQRGMEPAQRLVRTGLADNPVSAARGRIGASEAGRLERRGRC